MVPQETVSFVFPRLRLGKHQDSRENKTNCFPRDHTLSVYYLFRETKTKLTVQVLNTCFGHLEHIIILLQKLWQKINSLFCT